MNKSSPFPETIGRYRILRKIGEGGMGAVFEAQQDNPRRKVALKVVHAAMLSDEALRRFRLETQVLGRLQHPGIAQIFEADQFDAGTGPQPYFAMELIEGELLTNHAKKNNLSIDDRLDLIAQICDAVQHAHQRGVIHRDLKPGNILVTADGQPKILDFGVARATDAEQQMASIRTNVGEVVGTLSYMSPEQASGDPELLDTRSDVYSLGVIAYQLLCGQKPHDLHGVMVHQALQIICHQEPKTLSAVHQALRGDVETIVGKALEKEPDRRYPSASALASDIRRFLADEPITARPASAIYQIRKFARRNRALVGATLAVLVAVVVGLVGTWRGYLEAERKREIADQEATRANQEAARATQTATFLRDILAGVDPAFAQGEDTTLLKRILDSTGERIDTELTDVPEIEASIRSTLGVTYRAIGDYEPAERHFRRAIEIRRELGELDSEDMYTDEKNLVVILSDLGEGEAALDTMNELYSRGLSRFGDEHPVTDQLRCELGILYWMTDEWDMAARYIEPVLEYRRRVRGDDHEDTMIAINCLGLIRLDQGKYEEAESLLKEALERRTRTQGPGHPETVKAVHNLGGLYSSMSRYKEAEALYLQANESYERILGPDHPTTIQGLWNLALLYRGMREPKRAIELMEVGRERAERELGADHPDYVQYLLGLGIAYRNAGRIDEAARLLHDVYHVRVRELGPEDPDTLRALGSYASVLPDIGRLDEARRTYAQLLEVMPRVFGAEHPDTLTTQNDWALELMNLGEDEASENLLRHTLASRRAVLGNGDFDTLVSMASLARCCTKLGRHREALQLRAEFIPGWAALFHPADDEIVKTTHRMAENLERLDDYSRVEEPLRALIAWHREHEPDDVPQLAAELTMLGESLNAQQRFEAAEEPIGEALDLWQDADVTSGEASIRTLLAYADCLTGQERWDESEPLYLECWDGTDDRLTEVRARIAGSLVALYELLEDAEQADEWRAQLTGG